MKELMRELCDTCGDNICNNGENCASCQHDCGKCSTCGDGTCNGDKGETCASCQNDCGVCSVCGNNKCEPPYETCTNCAGDCGSCTVKGCIEVVGCAFTCIDLDGFPPQFSTTCVANCVSQGCANVQFFVDQVLTCAVQALISECLGGGDTLQCIQEACSPEIAACIGATCN